MLYSDDVFASRCIVKCGKYDGTSPCSVARIAFYKYVYQLVAQRRVNRSEEAVSLIVYISKLSGFRYQSDFITVLPLSNVGSFDPSLEGFAVGF